MAERERDPIRIITLSREYGAGGSELGVLLGRELGWPVLDRDLAQRIAERLRCPREDVEALAEHAPSLLERLATVFTVVPSEAPIVPDLATSPDADQLVEASREVLLEASRTPPLIVIGHGGNCLLRDRPDVLRVRVTAPYDERVRRIAERRGIPIPQAAADTRHRDADRLHYLERYYRSNANDPSLYDIQINTATVPLAMAARLVVALVRGEGAVSAR